MKNLDKTLWIKRIFMVLMDICIVILTSITALIVRFEFSLFGCTKVLYWRCMEFIAGNVSDRDYCILCISFV